MPHVTVNGRRLQCEWIRRSRTGPVLVLLHDGLGCVSTWRDFPTRLADTLGRSVFVASRRGYGTSAPFDGPLPDSFMHDEAKSALPALLRDQGIDDAILVGHSDGASIALIAQGCGYVAARALVLIAPHVFVEQRTVDQIRADVGRYRDGDLAPKLRRHHDSNAERMFRTWTDVWLRPSFCDWNIEEHLRAIRCPVLVIQGEDDAYGTLEQVERVRRGVSGPVHTVLLDACGHSAIREQPDDTLAAICAFVDACAS